MIGATSSSPNSVDVGLTGWSMVVVSTGPSAMVASVTEAHPAAIPTINAIASTLAVIFLSDFTVCLSFLFVFAIYIPI